ncbi:MAG: M56 family metallopeptidase [bacterium]
MSAGWMLGSALVSLLCWLAAMALVRVASLYRGVAIRWVWIGGAALSIGIAGRWLDAGSASRVVTPAPRMQSPIVGSSRAAVPDRVKPHSGRFVSDASSWEWSLALPAAPLRVDRAAFALWLTASVTMLGFLLVAARRLRRDRSTWRPATIAGTSVLVSERFGPALVGLTRPSIVLPSWVLSLDEHAQRMIVRHEDEHRAARDPALLVAAGVVLTLMPWNVGLWMHWRGLRRAVEIDCDARVVRGGVESTEYASVLLGAWRRSRGEWLPSMAFAERASGLGARVEHLMRPEPRERAVKSTAGAMLAVILVLVACTTPAPRSASSGLRDAYPLVVVDGIPRPELPPMFRFVGAVVAETVTAPRFEIHYTGEMAANPEATSLYPAPDEISEMQEIPAPTAEARFGPTAKYGVHLIYTRRFLEGGGRLLRPELGARFVRKAEPGSSPERMAGVVYSRMFRGIQLDSAHEERAVEAIRNEMKGQSALKGPVLAIWPKRIGLANERSAKLRALVSGADLVTLDANAEEYTYHEITRQEVERAVYASLLERMTLGEEDQTRARERIRTFVRDELAAYERSPDSSQERLALRMALEDELRTLVQSEADRTQYDTRVAAMRAHR